MRPKFVCLSVLILITAYSLSAEITITGDYSEIKSFIKPAPPAREILPQISLTGIGTLIVEGEYSEVYIDVTGEQEDDIIMLSPFELTSSSGGNYFWRKREMDYSGTLGKITCNGVINATYQIDVDGGE